MRGITTVTCFFTYTIDAHRLTVHCGIRLPVYSDVTT